MYFKPRAPVNSGREAGECSDQAEPVVPSLTEDVKCHAERKHYKRKREITEEVTAFGVG
jgi:hypothetical protein